MDVHMYLGTHALCRSLYRLICKNMHLLAYFLASMSAKSIPITHVVGRKGACIHDAYQRDNHTASVYAQAVDTILG